MDRLCWENRDLHLGRVSPKGLEHRTHWLYLALNDLIHLEAHENKLGSGVSCPHTFSLYLVRLGILHFYLILNFVFIV